MSGGGAMMRSNSRTNHFSEQEQKEVKDVVAYDEICRERKAEPITGANAG